MKKNLSKQKKLTAIACGTVSAMVLLGCSRETASDKKAAAKEVKDANPFGDVAPQNAPPEEAIAGSQDLEGFNFDRRAVRNYEELKSSIGVVTCVKDEDRIDNNNGRTFGQFFEDVSGNLPTTNDPEKYIAAHIVGSMNLASHACMLSVKLDSAASCQWSAGLREESDPSLAFTPENVEDLGKSIAENFWGMDPNAIDSDSPFITDLVATVDTLQNDVAAHMNEMGVNQQDQGRQIVEGVLISLCSAALSSSHFTTY